jgi:hypothetical protein
MNSWHGWASLVGQLAGGRPAVGQNLDGRLELFAEISAALGPELGHVWQTSPNGGWSGWSSLGAPPGQFLAVPTAGRNAGGRLEVFVRVGLMSAGALWHLWQTVPGGGWSAWSNLGGDVGAHVLAIGQNQDGRQEAFAVASAGTLRHIWQTSPNGGWSAWDDLGAPPGTSLTSGLAVGPNLDGRLEVFAAATDGSLWHLWQQAANGGWGGWDALGSPAGLTPAEPAVGRNQDGRLEVFAVVQDALWHIWQTAPGGTWGPWSDLGTPAGVASLGSPAVAQNADGRLEVFVFGIDGAVWHLWQTSPGGAWSDWDTLGGQPGAGPAVGQNADGRLEVFVEDNVPAGAHAAWHRWQVSPGGAWVSASADWQSHGPAEATTAVGISPVGVLLAAGATGVWQSADSGGSWTRVSAALLGNAISFNPSGGLVWAVSRDGKQLLASSDEGTTWTARYTTSGQGHINAVLADPNTAAVVWAGMSAADTLAEVLRSANNGATWAPLLPASLRGGGGLSATNAGPLAALSGSAGLVLAGAQYYHSGGVLKTSDGGASWTLAYGDAYTPLAGASALAAGGASAASATIYAGLNVMQFGSLVRSGDGGGTWTDLSAQLPLRGPGTGGYVANIALDPTQPDAVYISMWDTNTPARTGVFVSADRGQTWTEVGHLGLQVAGPNGFVLDAITRNLYAATAQGVYSYPLTA